jgi:uncharacterized protein (DUF1800 family)
MTTDAQIKETNSFQRSDETELVSPICSPSSAIDVSASTAVIGMTVAGVTIAGAAASTALAENRMPQRLPRGFSIKKSTIEEQRSTTEINISEASAVAPENAKEAARFLAQATMGTSKPDIVKLQALGAYSIWIQNQFTQPLPTLAMTWLFSKKFNVEQYKFDSGPFYQTIWRLMISSNTQLRQRIVFALSNIFVINANSLNMAWPGFAAANFNDILQANAFGNFRTILDKVTLSSAMGSYLNMRGNYKADSSRNTEPDENYARELLQLFTIGLFELNQDGTPKLSNGNPIDTYNQNDITGLARVLTGWDFDDTNPATNRLPMKHYPERHELGAKTFLGLTIPAGTNGPASLKLALDHIYKHPNVGPYLAMGLIRRLVTSNPSSAYVSRVSAAFNNNGAGVRGDMKAVITAVLLDAEARTPPPATYVGKQREEILRFTAWARALQVRSPDQLWSFYIDLNQLPYRSPTVFNFFKPTFTPSQSDLANQGLVAPEFQLTNETSVFQYINMVESLGYGRINPCVATYTALTPLALNSKALLDEINLLIAAGQVSDARIAQFAAAITPMGTADLNGKLDKVKAAITLIMTSPEFIIVK